MTTQVQFAAAAPPISKLVANKLDALGEFISLDTNLYLEMNSWTKFFHARKGRSNLSPGLNRLRHRAANLLHRFATRGIPVLISAAPWTQAQKDAAILRGNHPSAHAFTTFLREEMADMREKGMFLVLPYELVRDIPQLRISPIGVVPQRERRPRMINDYTFSGVNPSTIKLAPAEAMQWGRTLNRLLWMIYHADRRQGPVYLSKTDLSDGFYQFHLTPTGSLSLATPFPNLPHEPKLVSIPTRLPMGWTDSPPWFSSGTETIADLVNESLESTSCMPDPHPLEYHSTTPVPLQPSTPDPFPVLESGPVRPSMAYVDVFVDDFCKLAQGWENCLRVKRQTYHTIDQVFRRNDSTDTNRKEPISVKKLQKGDDFWSTQKTLLGWCIDTVAMSVELPPHRKQRLLDLLTDVLKSKRTSVLRWQKLLGELRSMTLAIPGSRGCFSFLQEALKPQARRVKLSPAVKDQLKDFLWLAQDVTRRPTHLAEVVPTPPTYYGASDAAKAGMGGVWFPPLKPSPLATHMPAAHALQHPILWRSRFPREIQSELVSFSNPTGSITNSDLELAGTVAHDDILAQTIPVHHLTSCTFCDNTPAVAWRGKGSTTTTGPAAYLLQQSSLHQRHFRYKPDIQWIAGTANSMADDCSRLWNYSDRDLTRYFNSTYPQKQSWKMHHLRPAMNSALISSLLRTRSPPESFLPAIPKLEKHGTSGVRFAPPSMSTPTFRRWPIQSLYSRRSECVGATDASLPVTTPTGLAQLRMPSGLSARSFPHWGPKILV